MCIVGLLTLVSPQDYEKSSQHYRVDRWRFHCNRDGHRVRERDYVLFPRHVRRQVRYRAPFHGLAGHDSAAHRGGDHFVNWLAGSVTRHAPAASARIVTDPGLHMSAALRMRNREPNHRVGVDAGCPVLFAWGHPWPGTTQHGRSVRATLCPEYLES